MKSLPNANDVWESPAPVAMCMIDRIETQIEELAALGLVLESGDRQTEETIAKLESLIDKPLPQSYREFLAAFGYCGDYFGISAPETIESVGVYAMTEMLQRDYGMPNGFLVVYYNHDLELCYCIDMSEQIVKGEYPMACGEFRGSSGWEISRSKENFLEHLVRDFDSMIQAAKEADDEWK